MEKEEATPFGDLFANCGEFFVITVLPYAFPCQRCKPLWHVHAC